MSSTGTTIDTSGSTPRPSDPAAAVTTAGAADLSANAPALWAVLNTMDVLSSPVGLASSRLTTRNRVTLFAMSSMFSQTTFSPYNSPATFEPMAAA